MTEPNPLQGQQRIFSHSFSVLAFLGSFLWMLISYFNKSWIVLSKDGEDGEFQRGLFHDCVNSSSYESGIKCSPWGEEADFITPFKKPKSPCFFSYLVAWLALLLLAWSATWVVISVTYCCMWRKCTAWNKAHGRKLYLGAFGGVGLFILFGLLVLLTRLMANYFPDLPEGYEYSLGDGFYHFLFGGLFCHLFGLTIFFWDKLEETWKNRKGHQAIPLQERNPRI